MSNEEFLKNISLDGEIWKDVEDFEGLYAISSFGRLASLTKPINRGVGVYMRPPMLMKALTKNKKSEHLSNLLYKDGICVLRYRHRLVATAFLPNPNNYPIVEHLDCDPTNNHISNLRWTDQTGNMNNPISKERNRIAQLASVSKKRIPVVCLKDGIAVKTYPSMIAAEKDGFRDSGIDGVLRGLHKSHGGCQWMRLSDYENLNISDVKEL